jgi:protein-disulfide isomerase
VTYYLKERRRIERRLAYVQSLRDRADIAIELAMPERPRTAIELAGAPVRGPDDAAVTLVHFASLSSPDSVRSAAELRAIFERYPGAIRWLHRHHVDIYDELALRAAKLALLAQDQGRFWDFHDRVFGRPDALTPDTLSAIASEFGLSEDPAGEAELLNRLKIHFDIGRKAGVDRAPVVFVNGRYFNSTFSYERLHAMVAKELGAAPRSPRSPQASQPSQAR